MHSDKDRQGPVAAPTGGTAERSPLDVMKALRDEIRERLLRDVSEFRIYLALEEAIHSVEGGQAVDRPQRSRSLRILARQLLSERGFPQSTSEIAEGLRSLGAPTSENSISSSLSQSPDFISVRWGGRPRWWLAGLAAPPDA